MEEDIKFLWAAYKAGGIEGVGIPEELSAAEFKERSIDALIGVDEAYILEAQRPVGVMTVKLELREDGPDVLEPHVYWFPWASPRGKLETVVKFIADMEGFIVLVWSLPAFKTFFNHVCKRGILQRVGTVPGYFGEEAGCLFASKSK